MFKLSWSGAHTITPIKMTKETPTFIWYLDANGFEVKAPKLQSYQSFHVTIQEALKALRSKIEALEAEEKKICDRIHLAEYEYASANRMYIAEWAYREPKGV